MSEPQFKDPLHKVEFVILRIALILFLLMGIIKVIKVEWPFP